MQSRIICNLFYSRNIFSCCLSGLLSAFTSTLVMAEVDNFQSSPQQNPVRQDFVQSGMPDRYYTDQQNSDHTNPWLLQQQANKHKTQSKDRYYNPSDTMTEQRLTNGRSNKGKFVTPEILESLKHQQSQYQTVPNSQQNYSDELRYDRFSQSGRRWLDQGDFDYPVYGTGTVNPLYDAPAVSPWGSGIDVLNRGEAFPMVPKEAVGGFPPMHVPSIGVDNYKLDDSDNPDERGDYKVFNPFTFLPKSGIHKP